MIATSNSGTHGHDVTPRIDTIKKEPSLGMVAEYVGTAALPLIGPAARMGEVGELADLAETANMGRTGSRVGTGLPSINDDARLVSGEMLSDAEENAWHDGENVVYPDSLVDEGY